MDGKLKAVPLKSAWGDVFSGLWWLLPKGKAFREPRECVLLLGLLF